MFKKGVVAETERLLKRYGAKKLRRTGGIVYIIAMDLLRSKISQSEAIEQFQAKDWQYARRQKTWFKRNLDIAWFSTPEQAFRHLKSRDLTHKNVLK